MAFSTFKEVNKPNRSFIIFDDYSQIDIDTMEYILGNLKENISPHRLLNEYYDSLDGYYDYTNLNSINSKIKCLRDKLKEHGIECYYKLLLTEVNPNSDEYMNMILFIAYKDNEDINFENLTKDFDILSKSYEWN